MNFDGFYVAFDYSKEKNKKWFELKSYIYSPMEWILKELAYALIFCSKQNMCIGKSLKFL